MDDPVIGCEGISVLFVEDNKLDLLSFERFAKSEAYSFTYLIASSVQSAKELLQDKHFDVVISDFMLPDGTGHDIARYVSPIPTILVTGADREDVIVSSGLSFVFDYLSKDINHQHLRALPHVVQRAYNFSKIVEERDCLVEKVRELEAKIRREQGTSVRFGDNVCSEAEECSD